MNENMIKALEVIDKEFRKHLKRIIWTAVIGAIIIIIVMSYRYGV